MASTISQALKQMLFIVKQLKAVYPQKNFTLDGRLIGDIGEILAEETYNIELHEDLRKHHDAKATDGRQVQIKATMQNSLTFPVDHIPDYYLGIKIHADGTFTEIFNGPGLIAWESVKNRKATKTNLHSVSINALGCLNNKVLPQDRIPKRAPKINPP